MPITIKIDHFVHIVRDPETARYESNVLGKLDTLKEALNAMAKTLDQMIQQQADMLAKVEKNTDLEKSIIQNQKDQAQLIKDLRAQLTEAGTDPAKLQALGVAMDTLSTRIDTEGQQAADAITANTPAA